MLAFISIVESWAIKNLFKSFEIPFDEGLSVEYADEHENKCCIKLCLSCILCFEAGNLFISSSEMKWMFESFVISVHSLSPGNCLNG